MAQLLLEVGYIDACEIPRSTTPTATSPKPFESDATLDQATKRLSSPVPPPEQWSPIPKPSDADTVVTKHDTIVSASTTPPLPTSPSQIQIRGSSWNLASPAELKEDSIRCPDLIMRASELHDGKERQVSFDLDGEAGLVQTGGESKVFKDDNKLYKLGNVYSLSVTDMRSSAVTEIRKMLKEQENVIEKQTAVLENELSLGFFRQEHWLRQKCATIIIDPQFERFILFLIFISSVFLALDEPHVS